MTISPERLKELQNINDSEIDTSDIPELDEQFWQKARRVEPISQETVLIKLDLDIINWFKHQTPNYKTIINQVLRAYINQQKLE
ncbi:MAG: BrnA antitoxin family protein [Okeania sp. SIO2F4]|uniref:BrnA antitoxin family protein n=1 Tax=Okeania sp. SIO2F4 TaxID=2607790 RepID=UPI00142C910E|nr:BrnA antitoxin family protein [Okeania sp. SIO2F4]NES01546.1 BrnA antitoxin family protein [Okeania sp. SIO2F4]